MISPFVISNPIIVGFVSLARWRRHLQPVRMTASELENAVNAVPFRPFEMVTGDGQRFPVPTPDHFSMSPSKRLATVWVGQRQSLNFGCVSHYAREVFAASNVATQGDQAIGGIPRPRPGEPPRNAGGPVEGGRFWHRAQSQQSAYAADRHRQRHEWHAALHEPAAVAQSAATAGRRYFTPWARRFMSPSAGPIPLEQPPNTDALLRGERAASHSRGRPPLLAQNRPLTPTVIVTKLMMISCVRFVFP